MGFATLTCSPAVEPSNLRKFSLVSTRRQYWTTWHEKNSADAGQQPSFAMRRSSASFSPLNCAILASSSPANALAGTRMTKTERASMTCLSFCLLDTVSRREDISRCFATSCSQSRCEYSSLSTATGAIEDGDLAQAVSKKQAARRIARPARLDMTAGKRDEEPVNPDRPIWLETRSVRRDTAARVAEPLFRSRKLRVGLITTMPTIAMRSNR